MASQIRGVEAHQEISNRTEWRDLRSRGERFKNWMASGSGMPVMAITLLGSMWLVPAAMELLFVAGMLLFYWVGRMPFALPFRMPAYSGMADPNDPDLNTKKSGPAAGIAFLGNELSSQTELWFKRDDMRTHLLVFGSTGSGKALPDDAPVHTPHGWVRIDTLSEGDLVSTADGRTAPVVGVFPQGNLPLYAVVLEDGRRIPVSGDHLWGVLPHRTPGPLERLGKAPEPEIIDTLELQRRLDMGEWPQGTQGWALPLPQAPDADADPEAWDVVGLVDQAIAALSGQGAVPDALVRGSRAQRGAFWRPFWAAAGARGMAAHVGRTSLLTSEHRAPLEAIVQAAWSMGHWACVEAQVDKPGFQAVIVHGAHGVRVLSVVNLEQEASCRCIKIGDRQGLFLTGDWVVTHNTEALISMAYNTLVHGSGFIYIDGKGDNKLWAKIFSMCRSLGREDDLLVINYMTGGRDVIGPQSTKLSNTLNPFITGTAAGLTELLVSLMDDGAGGGGDMWKNRGISLIAAIMTALVYQRDHEGILLDVDLIRENLVLENIQKMAKKSWPVHVITPIRAYLRSVPGYQDAPPNGKQSETTLEQHGYLQMQFTKILGSLSDTYGYIFRTNLGEVDFFDVVVNRRILVVLLPAMEKSLDELGNLGKIMVACLKQMMATGLGDVLEGEHRRIIETKPTNSPSTFMCILDEYGYYVVKGAAVMPAQARSLGFCMVFAGQDFPSFKKGNNQEEAAATIGNCNIKIFMKIEDPTDTADLFEKSVGEARVSRVSGFKGDSSGLGTNYLGGSDVNVEQRKRGNILDLKDQQMGEAHVLFKSTLVRARLFYANPPEVKRLQMNNFLRVKPPEREQMVEFDETVARLKSGLSDPRLGQNLHTVPLNARVLTAQAALTHCLNAGMSMRDSVLTSLVSAQRQSLANLESLSAVSHPHPIAPGARGGPSNQYHLDLFREHPVDDDHGGQSDFEMPPHEGVSSMLNHRQTQSSLQDLHRAAGASPRQAQARANHEIQDMQRMSRYPSLALPQMDSQDFVDIIDELDSGLRDAGDGYPAEDDEEQEDEDMDDQQGHLR